jgi:hypothetical protein
VATFEGTNATLSGVLALPDIRSKDWYLKGGVPLTKDGIVPFVHYVIREKGKIEPVLDSDAFAKIRRPWL